MLTLNGNHNSVFFRSGSKAVFGRMCQVKQINVFKIITSLNVIQFAELNYVCNQRQQTGGFRMNTPRKVLNILFLCNAGGNHFGIAGNARERGFQLVRNICREFLPHLFHIVFCCLTLLQGFNKGLQLVKRNRKLAAVRMFRNALKRSDKRFCNAF